MSSPHAVRPGESGFAQPAEWAAHEATLLAWPSAADLWEEALEPARAGFVALAEGIADWREAERAAHGERLHVLVPDDASEASARAALAHLPVTFHPIPFGDIWVRDTAPIVLTDAAGERASACFRFNGWGEKYVLEHDDRVSSRVAAALGFRRFDAPFVLEGGSVDVDGEGTVLTTSQCLENSNRNPGRDRAQIEADLREYLGATKTLWISEGLLNDHTDGHVDTIARFVRPGVVCCMRAADDDDPNHGVMERIARELSEMTDARGRRLEVAYLPSPGRVLDDDGQIMPASYANFYIANTTVIVPQYGVPADVDAVRAVAALFPGRRTLGAPAKAILTGGGAFHCITQQIPRGSR